MDKWLCTFFEGQSFKVKECFLFEGSEDQVQEMMETHPLVKNNDFMIEDFDEAVVEFLNEKIRFEKIKEILETT